MKRIFISEPRVGLNDKAIKAARKKAIKKIKRAFSDALIINEELLNDNSPVAIDISLHALKVSDCVVFLKKWYTENRCMVENIISKMYGKQILYM